MPEYDEIIKNHPIWAALESVGSLIARAGDSVGSNGEMMALLGRIRAMHAFVGQRLDGTDQQLSGLDSDVWG